MEDKTINKTIRIPKDLMERIESAAKENGFGTVSTFIRIACVEALKKIDRNG